MGSRLAPSQPGATSNEQLAWEPAHEGNPGTLWGYDRERRLVGQVAYFDVVAGDAPGWVGYRHGRRVTGRCRSAELACHLVVLRPAPASKTLRDKRDESTAGPTQPIH
jgi:hypothetical protein